MTLTGTRQQTGAITIDPAGSIYVAGYYYNLANTDNDWMIRKYDSNGDLADGSGDSIFEWQPAVTLDSNTGNDYPTLSIDTAHSNNLYAFWVRSENIYCSNASSPYGSDNWSAATPLITTGNNTWLSSAYQDADNHIFFEWTWGESPPYNISFFGLSTYLGGGHNFDLTTISLANNDTHLFALIEINGTLNFSDSAKYYRLFISKNDSTGNEITPETDTNLPVRYDYRVQVNGSACYIYNSTDINNNLSDCSFSNNSDTIELAINLSDLNITTGDNINLTFETGSSAMSYDFAPDYRSFLSYTLVSDGPDETPPTITIQSPQNQSYPTTSIWFNLTLDELGDWCGYSLDAVPNITMINSSGNWNAENSTMTEGSHNVTFSCNDTEGNMNSSAITEYFTVDLTYPQYLNNQTNSTEAGAATLFSLYWQDNIQLAGYIFSFDNGNGTFYNDSYVEMTGTANWSNVTKSVNSTTDTTIRWIVYANDTAGNLNTSSTYSFQTIAGAPATVTAKTYSNSSYSETDKFFDRLGTVFVESNVTDSIGNPITDATVKANFTVGGSLEKSITLFHYSGASYRGNWTTNSTNTAGIYTVIIAANNSAGTKTGNNKFHLYSGENVSAYHMDWNEDGVNESVIENKHLIAVFNKTDNTSKLMLYLEQKDTNVSYTFGGISDSDSLGKGEVTTTNLKEIKLYNFSVSSEGENLALVDLSIRVNDVQWGESSTLGPVEPNDKSYQLWHSTDSMTCGGMGGNPLVLESCNPNWGNSINTYCVGLNIKLGLENLKFSISSIPSGAIINSANITLTFSSPDGGIFGGLRGDNLNYTCGGTIDYGTDGALDTPSANTATTVVFNVTSNVAEDVGTDNFEAQFSKGMGASGSDNLLNNATLRVDYIPVLSSYFNLTIGMRTQDADYLVYKLNNFDSNITNISEIWSDLAGTFGSSVSDDRYHLEDGTDGLVSSLTKDQWSNYAINSNYSLIYDNSSGGDSVNDNVIAWVRFNETENTTLQDVGLWNDSTDNTGGFRIRYNTTNTTATDEVNYILAFTKGDYNTIHQWMSPIEAGNFPTTNFMTAPAGADETPPSITIQSPINQSYPITSIWFNVTLNEPGSWCGYSLDGAANVTMTNSSGNWNNLTTVGEGTHNVTFACNDTAGNMNSSAIIEYFTIDVTSPQYSQNQTNSTVAAADTLFSLYWQDNIQLAGYIFSFDNGTGTLVNDTYIEMTSTGNWSNVTKTVNSTTDTTIRWIIYANDTTGNMNTSDTYTFQTESADETPPTITIQSPENHSYPTTSIWFNITLDEPGDWCAYSLDAAQNITMTNSSGNWNNLTTVSEGSHNVTFACNDTSGNMNSSAITEYFTVDVTYPQYTTYNPQNSAIFSKNAEVNFNITTDENTNMTVNYWNSSTIYTLTNTSYTLLPQNTSTPLSTGAYNWNFTICDPAGLCNQSGTYSFSIHGSLIYDQFRETGSTTNLDFISADTNISNLILETGNGQINWTQNITLNDTYDLDAAIDITYNKIFVNTTMYPNLNTSAHLTMQNLNFGGVKILKDGADCPSTICQNITWDTQTGLLEFDVTHFSEYEAAEANQSKIDNNKTDSLDARIYVLMKVQYYNSGTWIDDDTVIDDIISRNISQGNLIKLDSLFNGKWNTTTNATYGSGTYRAYAAVTDENNNVLKNIDGTWLNATYNFTLTLAADNAPIITIISPQNTTDPTTSVWFNVTLNKAGDWCAYSLDGAQNITMDGSATTWNKQNTSMALGSHNVTFSCNDTGGLMNTTDPLYFTVHNTTSINPVIVSSATPNIGDILNISARLLNASLNPLDSQNISFYYNDTYIGSNTTNSTGWAVYTWDTTGVSQSGTYFINATFNGNDTLYAYRSHNDSTQITMSYKSISIHEADNATDKIWALQGIHVNFNYHCYAGLDSCNDNYADNSDGDGTPENFTIENTGDSVDVLAYVTADYDNSDYYICSSNDGEDGDHGSCINSPATGENGADNLQIYIPAISGWRSIPNTARDGTASALAIACDIPASTNISGIDFQVRAPYGTKGAYSATIIFVAYSDKCTDGQEGNYFQP